MTGRIQVSVHHTEISHKRGNQLQYLGLLQVEEGQWTENKSYNGLGM